MRLKQLTIYGFKSFAEKVVIDLDSPIAAIVGPNGCGKSNIVDAFLWVMGEQSAKSMRGEKMEDVLFAGTEKRRPIHVAEVSVTLSDLADALPVPYAEITITRRLYRNGNSEYLLNKQQVRLKDIQELFLGTGVGKNAFSIFAQGKLDQIIYLSPYERRGMFEEAAGIGRFLLKRKEAEKKLHSATENFNRIYDLFSEVERQTKVLKKQASLAKTFLENRERLQYLEHAHLQMRSHKLMKKKKTIEDALTRLHKEEEVEQGKLHLYETNNQQLKENVREKELLVKTTEKHLTQLQMQMQVQQGEVEQKKERLSDLLKRENDLKKELVDLEKDAEFLLQEKSKHEKEFLSISEKKNVLAFQERQAKDNIYFLEGELQELKKDLKESMSLHALLVVEERKLFSEKQEKEREHEQYITCLEAIEKKEKLSEKLEEDLALQKSVVEELVKEITKIGQQLIECQRIFKINQEQKKEREKEEKVLLQEIATISAREKLLLQLKEGLEGVSKGSAQLLRESHHSRSALKGKLKFLFEIITPHDKATIGALRFYSDTLIVETEEDMKLVVEHAAKKGIRGFSIFSLHQLKPNKLTEETLISYFLKDVQTTCFSREFKDLHLFSDHKGVLFCEQEGASIFQRVSELKEVQVALKQLFIQKENFYTSSKELEKTVTESELECEKVNEWRRKLEMKLVQENFILQRKRQDIDSIKKDLQQLLDKKKNFNVIDLTELSNKYANEKQKEERTSENLKIKAAHIELKEKNLHQARKSWQEINETFHNVHVHYYKLEQSLQQITKDIDNFIVREKKIQEESFEITELKGKLFLAIKQKAEQLQTWLKEANKVHEQYEIQQKNLTAARKEEVALTNNEKDQRVKIALLAGEKQKLEINAAELSTALKELESQIQEKGVVNSKEVETNFPNLDAIEKEIMQLHEMVENAGPINLTAIESYQEQETKRAHLEDQLTDLKESKKELEEIIQQLEGESKKLFRKKFEEIRRHFQKTMSMLFNGGEADLKFTDSGNILQSGIEIIVRPPGKQMRSISLLSGGEKCLTALGLLFSFFSVCPAPFCILDEVDAPLDDSNIEKFTALLKTYISQTQFLIVTHNKKTMAIADVLIGVSMEEKGISKLISLTFEKKTVGSTIS